MDRHLVNHTNTHLTSNLPPKVARREPNIIDPPANDRFLEHHSMLEQNSQRSFGVTPADVPDEIRQGLVD